MVGQGCDISMFDETHKEIVVTKDLEQISKPIIGYFGFITTKRMDICIIEYFAQKRPNWNIVLVEPEDDDFKNSVLHSLKNVHFLGSRNPESLPQYIKGFDVCINPQDVNNITIGNYPRKIDEYLAIGKPVVATKTEAMEYFAENVY